MAKVTRSNPKAFEQLDLNLKELEGAQAKVGWFETAKYPNGTPVAMAAAANELGHGKTPPRPFMRPTAAKERGAWASIAAAGAKLVLQGKSTIHDVMEMVGIAAEGNVLQAIMNVNSPPLSPITIELRAMKKRNPDLQVTGKTVGIAAAKVNEPGYRKPVGINEKPLEDTGLMVATLTHIVEEK